MNVTIYSCRAKPGKRDSLIAWYRDWQCRLSDARGFLAAELLCSIHDPSEFVAVVRFDDESASWSFAENLDYRASYAQMVSLAEEGPIVSHYQDLASDAQASRETGNPDLHVMSVQGGKR